MNNKKSGNFALVLAIDLLIAIAYAIITLVCISEKSAIFWVVFVSTIAMILSQILTYVFFSKRNDGVVFAIPAMRNGIVFTLIQFALNIVFIGMSNEDTLKYAVVGQLVFLIVYTIYEILSIYGMKSAIRIEDAASANRKVNALWSVEAMSVVNELKGSECEHQAKRFYDEVKYANPKSVSASIEYEEEITRMIKQIAKLAEEKKNTEATEKMEECIKVIKKRNEICKISD